MIVNTPLSMDRHPPVLPIACEGVALVRRGRELLKGISLELPAGGPTVVLGPNGAGKSLLLRVLAGLLKPDDGAVTWAGSRIAPEMRLAVGLVFQKPVLLRRTARANMVYALKAAGIATSAARDLAGSVLDDAGLGLLADSPARLMSGGEQQRLATARALALAPRVLLMDEPTAHLDPESTLAIERLVKDAAQSGTTVVWVTHDLAQARRLADSVIFLLGGQVEERNPAAQFFEHPASEAAKTYLTGGLPTA